jgi:RNA polymerase sigma-70 factor (ECF subfamily)
LFQVAYNEAMMIRRREQTGRRATDNVAWMMRVTSDPDRTGEAIQMAIEAENVERVRDALERLPEPIRDIVVLRIHEGLKFAEIANRLDVPLGTVLARMRSGLGKLKSILKNL